MKKKRYTIKFWPTTIFATVAVTLFIVTIVVINVHWAIALTIPSFGQLHNRLVTESTKIYDRTGNVLLYDTTGTMRRITVPLTEISPYIIKATIAIEDDSFYNHGGIRPLAIFRSLLANIGSISIRQGGSTITQQVIKNTLLTKDKSLVRKIKEWILALRIEKTYSKDQILETYLNETPYGGTIYGVEQASQEYFGKKAKDITLAESAYLTALPKAPSFFSPWGENFTRLTARQNLVLNQMKKNKLITEAEYEQALAEKVIFREQGTENIRAPHFVFYVLKELEKKYTADEIYRGGLQVITTLDWNLQQDSEKIIRVGALSNEKKFNASNAGLVALDPQTGQVLAMVGSRNYFDNAVDGQVNTTLALRQPGSTFKPIVYATAFKKGYTPESILFDLKTQFSTACAPNDFSNVYPCYSPDNYDGKFKGPISLRDALAQSVNVVGVKTLYLSGIKESIKTAQDLGITTLTEAKRYGLSLVLGGGEVTLLEMTSAYGTFANDGVRYPITPILAIHSPTGNILDAYKAEPKQVLEKEIARTINDILSDNVARTPEFGANSPLYFAEAKVADKTGTTNDFRDTWVIGYTPSVVVGTWAGNNDNTPMEKKIAAFILAPMWHEAMAKAIERFPGPPFPLAKKTKDNMKNPDLPLIDFSEGLKPDDSQYALWQYPVGVWLNELAFLTSLDPVILSDATSSPAWSPPVEGAPLSSFPELQ